MTRPAAIYARVSSDRQKENHTICSQLAALEEYAGSHGYLVPPEWRFQEEGYSGATLLRPGLEALRDLAAAGHMAAALVYSPDRLSRKYAYQVLLAEELSRCGVELVFLKAPSGATPEDQLLVQFQGMIAEYERAQIAERSRRGKRHRAHQGSINVLSGAPYGYRYVMARPSFVHGRESRDRCGNTMGWPAAIVPITNDRARTGSRLPFPPWSAKRPSR
jgi:site-specific DNA recombinase